MIPNLDAWIEQPTLRVRHARSSSASPQRLWAAARELQLDETGLLGRLVRWRIPGTRGGLSLDELFREPPFIVLEQSDRSLVSGLVGRIWTLRRDYPQLSEPDQFRSWSARGTVRVLFGSWAEDRVGGGSKLVSESRVQAFGVQGRLGLGAVRPLVRSFNHLIGSEGIQAAVRAAEAHQ